MKNAKTLAELALNNTMNGLHNFLPPTFSKRKTLPMSAKHTLLNTVTKYRIILAAQKQVTTLRW